MKNDKNLNGPIAKALEPKLTKLGRSLQIMDINIYDKISARYGDCQPKGGVVFNSPIRYISKYAENSVYAVIDAYGRGDLGNILHNGGITKFASKHSNARMQGYWNRPMPFPSNITSVLSKMSNLKQVLLGRDSDPFPWMDLKYLVTLEILKQFLNSPIETLCINTRSDLVVHDKYFEVLMALKNKGVNVHVSMHRPVVNNVALNDSLTEILEPGCISLKRREIALQKLKDAGIGASWSDNQVAWSKDIHKATGLMQHQWDFLNVDESYVESRALAERVPTGSQS